jgi:hypothetical protein
MADIDLGQFTGTEYNIIGERYYDEGWVEHPFTGVFDGNGHTISNFIYTSTDKNMIGIFGYVRGEIKDLDLLDPNINAGNGNYVGGIAGYLQSEIISNCRVKGGSVCGGDSVGGVVGISSGNSGQSIIRQCHSDTTVSGRDFVGGLAGEYDHYKVIASIEDSSAIGDVFATGSNSGGLVGWNWCGRISNCYSTGSVAGFFCVGGLVGMNFWGTISNCYSTATVSGGGRVGGLVGDNDGKITYSYSAGSVLRAYEAGGLVGYNLGNVMACFWDIETSGQNNSAGGKGKTTAEMQIANTFIGWTGCGNEGIWALDEGNDYPHLWWEQKPGALLPAYKLSDFIAGTGMESDPYLIYTADELNMVGLFSCDWDKHFKLMDDIDLCGFTDQAFNIIGIDSYNAFTGVFDGNGHTITNFTYSSTETNYIGLFGYVKRYVNIGEIRNLGLIDPNVDAGTGAIVGSLAGSLQTGTISNCYVKGGNVFGSNRVGGLVGTISNISYVMDCYTETNVIATGTSAGSIVGGISPYCIVTGSYAGGSVSGNTSVGGLIGTSYWGEIKDSYSSSDAYGIENVGGLLGSAEYGNNLVENCYATGIVSGIKNSGGLIGKSVSSTVSDCYSESNVIGTTNVGGLVGYGTGSEYVERGGLIEHSYCTGHVIGDSNVGGLIGTVRDSNVVSSFWDIETTGQTVGYNLDPDKPGTVANVLGMTTDKMRTQSTFTDYGWDFINVWGIGENQTYPYLRRYLAGDINKDGIVNFKDFAIVALKWLEEYNVGNRAPEVMITYPEDGERLMVGGVPPQTLITAEAEDSDGTVVWVEFFDGEMKLGEDTGGIDGWNFLWQNYSLGWHTLTAVAWDEEGLSGASAPVTVEVWMPDPPPP